MRAAFAGGHAGVVGDGIHALLDESGGQFLCVLAGRRIDDARLRRVDDARDQRLALVLLLREALDREANVRSVEAAHHDPRLAHPQSLNDLPSHRGRRGCGERQDTGMRERLDDCAQAKVLRAEVVSPLADAVGLVDDKERRLARLHAGKCLLVRKLFRRQEEELGCTLRELVECFLTLGRKQSRVEQRRAARIHFGDRLNLVLLQGNQRRHHDGDARDDGASDLIDSGLPRARRHDRECVVAGKHGGDGLFLARPQLFVPQFRAGNPAHGLRHVGRPLLLLLHRTR